MKRSIQVARGTAAAIATVDVPNAAFLAVQLFQTATQPTVGQWIIITIGLALLANATSFYEDEATRGKFLAVMPALFCAMCLGDALLSRAPVLRPLASSLAWAGLALVAVLGVPVVLRPKEESWFRHVTRVELVRLSAFVFSQAWNIAVWVGVKSLASALLITAIIIWPVVACLIRPGFTADVKGGRTLVGTGRWILTFVVGKNLVFWVIAPPEGNQKALLSFVLSVAVYSFLFYVERPKGEVLAAEQLALLGSGVALVLLKSLEHIGAMGPEDQKYPPVMLIAYGLVCLGFIVRIMYVRYVKTRNRSKPKPRKRPGTI